MAEKPKVKEIFHEIANKAGLPDDQAKAWLATLDNQQLQEALGEVMMTRADYSRAMDEVKKTREQAESERREAVSTREKQVVWCSDNKRALDEYPTLKKQLEAYRTMYGELDASTTTTKTETAEPVNGKYATADDIRRANAELWSLQDQLEEAKDHYYTTFGKPMPYARRKELITEAQKPENLNRPLRDVYDRFIAADVKIASDAATQKRIDDAVAAARSEERSKRHFPDETGQDPNEEISPLYRPIPDKATAVDEIALQKEFIQGLYEKPAASP